MVLGCDRMWHERLLLQTVGRLVLGARHLVFREMGGSGCCLITDKRSVLRTFLSISSLSYHIPAPSNASSFVSLCASTGLRAHLSRPRVSAITVLTAEECMLYGTRRMARVSVEELCVLREKELEFLVQNFE